MCDRGGEVVRRSELQPEMRYAGGRLVRTGFLSCARHMDAPNPQFGGQRPLRPDPVPVRDPRPERQIGLFQFDHSPLDGGDFLSPPALFPKPAIFRLDHSTLDGPDVLA